MSTIDYSYHQELVADAIQQYRGHTERDLEDLQLLREQTALQASLMDHISKMMTSLQQSLLQRHEVLTATMDPIDSPMGES